MSVLVLNGSPKGENSNTIRLTQAFLEGAALADAELINVSAKQIQPCLGCFSCWDKTPGKCVLGDDMADLIGKIVAAKVIIWSFPLYYFSIPGRLKNLIDRQLPLNLPFMAADSERGGHPSRYDLSRQKHVIISTCGFWTARGNYDGVAALFDRLYDQENYARIYCGQGELFRVPELESRTGEYLELVRKAGGEWRLTGAISPATQAALAEPLYPREVFEKMADASWGLSDSDNTPTEDDGLAFTKQMAALYTPDGKERILEMRYTDLGKTYQILLSPKGAAVTAANFKPYSTRINTPYSVWRAISRGEVSGQEALFQRQYTVDGDFELMLHWDELFSGGVASSPPSSKSKEPKTNMLCLLVPWILIWVFLALNPVWGGGAGIAASALIPFAWLVCKPTLYERITIAAVSGLSLGVLLGVPVGVILPLSYALFGLLWFGTAFAKIPLTAPYSANGYGGEKAFENPLFLRTNRILTACWGVLYLLTAPLAMWLLTTEVGSFTGAFTTAVPTLMGIFTIWFQKWYPAHYARKK